MVLALNPGISAVYPEVTDFSLKLCFVAFYPEKPLFLLFGH